MCFALATDIRLLGSDSNKQRGKCEQNAALLLPYAGVMMAVGIVSALQTQTHKRMRKPYHVIRLDAE